MCDEVLRIGFFVQPQILENADFGNTVDSPDRERLDLAFFKCRITIDMLQYQKKNSN